MVKKGEKKIGQNKKSSLEIQEALIQNFVGMQRVLTNLAVKFDMLSDNINKLLQLFEISAKSFIKKQEEMNAGTPLEEEDKELLGKIDTLMDQNKTIAKSLTLVEEKIRHKMYGEEQHRMPPISFPRHIHEKEQPRDMRPSSRPMPKI